jgi:hypothetical protein
VEWMSEPSSIWSEVSQAIPDSRTSAQNADPVSWDSGAAIPEWFGRRTHELLDLRRVGNRRREKQK